MMKEFFHIDFEWPGFYFFSTGYRTIKQVFRADWCPERPLNLICFPELVQLPGLGIEPASVRSPPSTPVTGRRS